MKRVLLIVLIVTAAAFGMAAFVHPDGVEGALGMLGVSGEGSPATGGTSGGESRSPGDAAHAAARSLGKADEEYDAGRFDRAILMYTAIESTAPNPSLRERAKRSGQRATLAHALIDGVPAPRETEPGARRARLDELASRARSTNTEGDWLAALRYAASIGAGSELAALARGALSTAVAGGPVNTTLNTAAARAGGAALEAVTKATVAHGLSPAGHAPGGTKIVLTHPEVGDDEPSGIGGVGPGGVGMPRVDVPAAMLIRGNFSAATKRNFERAVAAEREGLQHFQLSGAAGSDRKEHRRNAYRLLKEAQGIFDAATEEDNSSSSLESHIVRVNRAIALLRKEMAPDELH